MSLSEVCVNAIHLTQVAVSPRQTTQSDSLRGENGSNEGVESSAAPNQLNPPGRGVIRQSMGDPERQSPVSPRPGLTGDSQPISHEGVEDGGARETQAAAESRLNQVR